MTWEPGTACRIAYDVGDGSGRPVRIPIAGDFLRTVTGRCYLIDDARPSPTIVGRVYLKCTRLGREAVRFGQPGVWPLYWHPRVRRRSA